MVFAPGHFQEVAQPRSRGPRERIAVRFFALLAIVLIGVVIYSLTTHQHRSGHGCVDFNYTTMIGGAETYDCGAEARTLCLTPPAHGGIDGDFQTGLYAACRKAGLPVGRARGHLSAQP